MAGPTARDDDGGMDQRAYDDLLAAQSGVVARHQLLGDVLSVSELQRLVRRRDLTRLHPGVFVDHTGEPSWVQRAWAGVLHAWPAALCGESALRAGDGPGRSGAPGLVIHVAIGRHRRLQPAAGVRLHRFADLDHRVQWNLSPPRERIEHTLVDLAAGATDDMAAVAVLSDAIQARRTLPSRLRRVLDARSRVARRPFLAGLLDDLDAGTCSVLEHGYLTLVERAHGLPQADRQVRDSARGPIIRDVVYSAFGQIVELDGRLFHDSALARDADLDRDLDAAVGGRATTRLGWGQVFGRPCATAVRVGALLTARGWPGSLLECPRCPELAA